MSATKFKAGDRVRFREERHPEYFGFEGSIEKVVDGTYHVHIEDYGTCSAFIDHDLELIEKPAKTWDTLEVGDVLVCKEDDEIDEAVVLGVCGRVIFPSYSNEFGRFSYGCTKEELIGWGWRIKGATEETKTESIIREIEDIEEKKREDSRQDIKTYLQELLDKRNEHDALERFDQGSLEDDIEMLLENWDKRIKD